LSVKAIASELSAETFDRKAFSKDWGCLLIWSGLVSTDKTLVIDANLGASKRSA